MCAAIILNDPCKLMLDAFHGRAACAMQGAALAACISVNGTVDYLFFAALCHFSFGVATIAAQLPLSSCVTHTAPPLLVKGTSMFRSIYFHPLRPALCLANVCCLRQPGHCSNSSVKQSTAGAKTSPIQRWKSDSYNSVLYQEVPSVVQPEHSAVKCGQNKSTREGTLLSMIFATSFPGRLHCLYTIQILLGNQYLSIIRPAIVIQGPVVVR